MAWSEAAARRMRCLVAAAGALVLAGCNHSGGPVASQAQPRGATVAFDTIDGLPPDQFKTLVKNLNDEAQNRRLAVISRESPATYRVRGALAITVSRSQSTVSWTWDVLDGDERVALRIASEETVKVRHTDAWAAADDAMLQRIASTSMEKLAAFLTSPEVAPRPAAVALFGSRGTSPEAAGIFRRPDADPIPAAATPDADDDSGPVPLPPRRERLAAIHP